MKYPDTTKSSEFTSSMVKRTFSHLIYILNWSCFLLNIKNEEKSKILKYFIKIFWNLHLRRVKHKKFLNWNLNTESSNEENELTSLISRNAFIAELTLYFALLIEESPTTFCIILIKVQRLKKNNLKYKFMQKYIVRMIWSKIS